jgi:hypothetical protein
MAAGAVIGGLAGGAVGKGAGEVVNSKPGDELHDHNLAKGVGAGGGAAAGASIGAVGGPIGAVVGAGIGAAVGGMAGKGVGGMVNPAQEDAHWRNTYQTQPYYTPGYTYDDYQPAYALGYNGKGRYTGSYDQNEHYLADEWNTSRGTSRLSWDQAKLASRDAWHKVERAIPGDLDRDGR